MVSLSEVVASWLCSRLNRPSRHACASCWPGDCSSSLDCCSILSSCFGIMFSPFRTVLIAWRVAHLPQCTECEVGVR